MLVRGIFFFFTFNIIQVPTQRYIGIARGHVVFKSFLPDKYVHNMYRGSKRPTDRNIYSESFNCSKSFDFQRSLNIKSFLFLGKFFFYSSRVLVVYFLLLSVYIIILLCCPNSFISYIVVRYLYSDRRSARFPIFA